MAETRELTASQAMQDALTGNETAHSHAPGTMDITTQERTFAGFMTTVTRGAIVVAALIVIVLVIFG